jgi:hypothetical protein
LSSALQDGHVLLLRPTVSPFMRSVFRSKAVCVRRRRERLSPDCGVSRSAHAPPLYRFAAVLREFAIERNYADKFADHLVSELPDPSSGA